MSLSDVEVVRQFTDAALAGDGERAMSMLDSACAFEEAESLPYGGIHVGHKAIGALLGSIFATFEIAPDPIELSDAETAVIARASATFTARATGRSMHMDVIEVYDIADGRIRRNKIFYHDTKALVGLLRAAP
jgi:hypothetical protein